MPPSRQDIETLRLFNRTVTAAMGELDEGLYDTEFSLSEARIVRELDRPDPVEVADLRAALGLDSGYLSRTLARLEERKVLERSASPDDGRRQVARLTAAGRRASALLDRRAGESATELLSGLSGPDRQRLVGAMRTVRDLLTAPAPGALVLRPAGSGDWGWIVERHGRLYADQYGWGERFEALVARIVADHVDSRDPRTDAAWIAELDGEPVGCVLCVREDDPDAEDEPGVPARLVTAKLRLLLVEPRARGMGVGSRLVQECLRFARRAGYRRMVLWTNAPLTSARPIYEAAGFELVAEEDHQDFGHTVTGQTFALDLAGQS